MYVHIHKITDLQIKGNAPTESCDISQEVKGLTFNRNIILDKTDYTVYSNKMESNLSISARSTFVYLWITIKYRKCSVPMHLGDGLSPTNCAQNKADDSFQCSCCKKSECVKFLHSVLAVAAVAVSFGTCALLWYRAKQEEEQPLPKQKQKLYTYLIRSLNIGS